MCLFFLAAIYGESVICLEFSFQKYRRPKKEERGKGKTYDL